MTYEAPPDNDHKVVRLHGTTESLLHDGKDSVGPVGQLAGWAGYGAMGHW